MDYNLAKLLKTYHCTLSEKDQDILVKISNLDSRTNRILRFNPFFWGDKIDSLKMKKVPTLDVGTVILKQYKEFMMKKTIREFPMDLKLDLNSKYPECSEIYDVRFILTSLFHILAPEKYINCYDFIAFNGLSITLISTSSKDERLRSLAYVILTRFYQHLQEARHFKASNFWITFLDYFRSSLKYENQQLPFTISYFLVNLVSIYLKPTNILFHHFRDFVIKNWRFNWNKVPPFLISLLKIQEVSEWKSIQKFVIDYISYCIKTEEDFELFKNNNIHQLLLTLYFCEFCLPESQLGILRFLLNCSKFCNILKILCVENSLIAWLNLVVNKLKTEKSEQKIKLVSKIVNNIWSIHKSKVAFYDAFESELILLNSRLSYRQPNEFPKVSEWRSNND